MLQILSDFGFQRAIAMQPSQGIIAQRTLFIVNARGDRTPVLVRLHSPLDHGVDWSCTYEIGWPEKHRSIAIHGIDAVQALTLALQMVGSELYMSRYHAEGTLVWNKPGDGYGFPVSPHFRDRLIGSDRN